MAGEKGVTIQIDPDDLKTLKASGYRLCFAKKVLNTYNVVWQSYDRYLNNNSFEWTPKFQLFGSNVFKDKVLVTVSTNEVDIELSETATLDESGILGPASTMINNYGKIHPALNQLSDGVDGDQISTPIYVAEKEIVAGIATLTPVEMVQVWFEQNIETSTMFSDARSMSVEIDLTNSANQTRLYKDGQWSKPSSDELARFAAMPSLALTVTGRAAPVAA
jgi:hypothetical protein